MHRSLLLVAHGAKHKSPHLVCLPRGDAARLHGFNLVVLVLQVAPPTLPHTLLRIRQPEVTHTRLVLCFSFLVPHQAQVAFTH